MALLARAKMLMEKPALRIALGLSVAVVTVRAFWARLSDATATIVGERTRYLYPRTRGGTLAAMTT